MTPGARRRATVLSLCFAGLILAGGVLPEDRFFPLSPYPMFSMPRPPVEPLSYVEMRLPDGSYRRVDVDIWADGGVSVGRSRLRALAPDMRQAVCADIAQRIAASGVDARSVRIVDGVFSRERESTTPLRTTTVVECR